VKVARAEADVRTFNVISEKQVTFKLKVIKLYVNCFLSSDPEDTGRRL
jgi:hypothetical protein